MVKILDIGRIIVKSGEREVVAQIRSLPIKSGELEHFRKLTIYKMTSVRKSYTFQSLLKNITLLPAERFGNINLHQQTVY